MTAAASITNLTVDWFARSITIFPVQEPALVIEISAINFGVEGKLPMAITITDNQLFTASVSAVSAKGNPASIEGVPAWEVSDPLLLGLVVDAAGVATVNAVGPLGVGQLRVSADADLGEGVRLLSGILDIEIVGGEAVALAINTTLPTTQP